MMTTKLSPPPPFQYSMLKKKQRTNIVSLSTFQSLLEGFNCMMNHKIQTHYHKIYTRCLDPKNNLLIYTNHCLNGVESICTMQFFTRVFVRTSSLLVALYTTSMIRVLRVTPTVKIQITLLKNFLMGTYF